MISINKHSSIKITGEKVIYIDPYGFETADNDADIIFFTHSHYDHLSPEDVKKCAKENTVFVAPLSCENDLKKNGYENAVLFEAGENKTVNGISVAAVPAYNKIMPFHPKKNGWLGYVINIGGEKIYVAGDTDMLEENENITCDIALLPVGGTFTMNFSQAAEFANKLKPKKVIPTHYGSVAGKPTDGEDFARLVESPTEVEILI